MRKEEDQIITIPLQFTEVEMILGEIAKIEQETDIGHGLSNLRNMLRASIGINLLKSATQFAATPDDDQ